MAGYFVYPSFNWGPTPPPPPPALRQVLFHAAAETFRAVKVGAGTVQPAWFAEMNRPGQVAVAGLATMVAWRFVEIGGMSWVTWAGTKLLPGVKKISALWSPTREVVVAKPTSLNGPLESVRSGSVIVPMTTPAFQVKIGYYVDGEFQIIGCGIRAPHDYLMAPDHVIGESGPEKYVKGRGDFVLSLKGKEREIIATDMAVIKLSANEWSRLQASVASFIPLKDVGDFAQVVGPAGQGSTGAVHHSEIFGRIEYQGSTAAGFSGAPYTLGNKVVGLHQMGGVVNSGYAARYLWMLLTAHMKVKEEDSDEYFRNHYRAGKTIRWETTHDPDEVQVRIDGDYHRVSVDVMDKAFGEEWRDTAVIRRKPKQSYGDYESVQAGEANSSKSPGASSSSPKSQDLATQDLQQLISALSSAPMERLQKVAKLLQVSLKH